MIEFVLLFIVSWISVGIIYRLTAFNIGVRWNGLGAIRFNLGGTNDAPMQYRMLQAWIFKFICMVAKQSVWSEGAVNAYKWMIIISLWFCLSSSYLYFSTITNIGMTVTMAMLAFIFIATYFDYVDVYWEVGTFALFLFFMQMNMFVPALIVVFLSSFNKESSIMLAAFPLHFPIGLSMIYDSIFIACIWALPQLLMRMEYGDRENYSKYVWGTLLSFKDNWKQLKCMIRHIDSPAWISVFIIFASIISLCFNPNFAIFIVGFIASTTAFGLVNESRIYLPLCLIFIPLMFI